MTPTQQLHLTAEQQTHINTNVCLHTHLQRLAQDARSYLEVGMLFGTSLEAILSGAKQPLELLVLCDIWQGAFDYFDHTHIHPIVCKYKRSATVMWLDGDSAVTLPLLARNVQVDLALVDGDHSENATKIDLENVWPHIRQRGHMVVHDTAHKFALPHMHPLVESFALANHAHVVVDDRTDVFGVMVLQKW